MYMAGVILCLCLNISSSVCRSLISCTSIQRVNFSLFQNELCIKKMIHHPCISKASAFVCFMKTFIYDATSPFYKSHKEWTTCQHLGALLAPGRDLHSNYSSRPGSNHKSPWHGSFRSCPKLSQLIAENNDHITKGSNMNSWECWNFLENPTWIYMKNIKLLIIQLCNIICLNHLMSYEISLAAS